MGRKKNQRGQPRKLAVDTRLRKERQESPFEYVLVPRRTKNKSWIKRGKEAGKKLVETVKC